MRRYESVVVISADLPETKVKEELAKIQGLIETHGGKDIKLDKWGTKEVGRRMRKPVSGHYFCFAYEGTDPNVMDVLTTNLRITDSVLKFQSFKINQKVRKFKGYIRKGAAESGDDLGDVELDTNGY